MARSALCTLEWSLGMDTESILLIVGVACSILALILVRLGSGKTKITTVAQANEEIKKVAGLLSVYAPVADKLLDLGEIEKENRREYVLKQIMPLVEHLTREQVRGLLEAWLLYQKKEAANVG